MLPSLTSDNVMNDVTRYAELARQTNLFATSPGVATADLAHVAVAQRGARVVLSSECRYVGGFVWLVRYFRGANREPCEPRFAP